LRSALALEHADGAALCRVQHCADQLRLSVAAATPALLYCLFSREVGRAEIVHRQVPLRTTNADMQLQFREFVLKVNIMWRRVEFAESAKAVNSIGSSELI
jgi:hypothetical protein